MAATQSRLDGSDVSRIIADLLDFERLSGGTVTVHRQMTDLTALIGAAVSRLMPAGSPVVVPEEPAWVSIDPGLAERIVENLLLNAIRHTPSGTPVEIGLTRSAGAAVMNVDDAGPGVPEADRDTIFEAFARPSASNQGGLGLGLYLVRRFAEIQSGRAWVETSPAGGASFRVRFPIN